MNPGSGQADKNGLCLQSIACVLSLRSWSSSGGIFLSQVIEMDWRVDRELLEKHHLLIYTLHLMKPCVCVCAAVIIVQGTFATQVHRFFIITLKKISTLEEFLSKYWH